MISNSSIQAAWIAKLKANANVTALVPAVEIREDLYKGTDFTYPNIRVRLGPLIPINKNPNCKVFTSTVAILIFIEQKSSKQADDISAVVLNEFWGKTYTSNGIRFTAINLDSLEPADVPESDTNSWQAIVNLSATVSES